MVDRFFAEADALAATLQRERGLTARDRDRRALSAESLFSLALCAVLALVMVLTRKVNWYGLTSARAMAPAQPLP